MKLLVKAICFFGGILLLVKLAQLAIDIIYDSYGKKYITTEDVE